MSEHYEITHFHLFCGLGGGARGVNGRIARSGSSTASFRCLGGVDSDPRVAPDFRRLAGAECTVLDLFGRREYEMFHGEAPPSTWREATPDDIRAAAGGERPNFVLTSPPCKGFSALISSTRAKEERYQALNSLTLRGVHLTLTAWEDDPPEVIVMENVPRIQQRGAEFLRQIKGMLRAHGYVVGETTYCCGEIGGLGQRRQRYMLLARHVAKAPAIVFEAPSRGLRSVGEVLESLPVPGVAAGGAGGPMHTLPQLQWLTWLRLALVEAGGDWRSLKRLDIQDGVVQGLSVVPSCGFAGTWGVAGWGETLGAVTGRAQPTTGAFSVADPRTPSSQHNGTYGVADPRPSWGGEYSQLGVVDWGEPMGTVSGQSAVGGGKYAVADPRLPDSKARHSSQYRVTDWRSPLGTVTGNRSGAAGTAISDPRLGRTAMNNVFRVVEWDGVSQAITAGGTPTSGGQAIADPRPGLGSSWEGAGPYGVIPWERPAGAVTASGRHDNGAGSVADPRVHGGAGMLALPEPREQGEWMILSLDGTWHRPLTTLELAYLQGLLCPGDYQPFEGESHAAWRERIGNAIPSPAAGAVAEVIGRALLAHWGGEYLQAGCESVWAREVLGTWMGAS